MTHTTIGDNESDLDGHHDTIATDAIAQLVAVPMFATWLGNHRDAQLADLAIDWAADPDFPWARSFGDMIAYVRLYDRTPGQLLITEFTDAVHLYTAFLWRQRAFARLKELVGDDDENRVLAIEVAQLSGNDEFADALLWHELVAVEQVTAISNARTAGKNAT